MPRYVQVNDPHISDQTPRMRAPGYAEQVLAKLAWAAAFSAQQDATLVITGDLFHRKNAAHTTHRTVQRTREALAAAPRVWIVPGNHDEAHGGGLDGQPLLSVVDGHRVRLLAGPSLDDPFIAGVPWSNAYEREGGLETFAAVVTLAARPLVFAHAPIADRPFPFGPEALGWLLDADVAAAMPPGVRLLAHGHMHDRQEVTRWLHAGSGWITDMEPSLTLSNPGALSRPSIADAERAPQIALITYTHEDGPDGLTVEYVDVPHLPAVEVFRLDEQARIDEREDTFIALARSFEQASVEAVDADVLRAMMGTLQRPDTIPERIHGTVEMPNEAEALLQRVYEAHGEMPATLYTEIIGYFSFAGHYPRVDEADPS